MRGINLPSDPKGKPVDIVRVPTPNSHHRPWNFHASVHIKVSRGLILARASCVHACILLNYTPSGLVWAGPPGESTPTESVTPGTCSSQPLLAWGYDQSSHGKRTHAASCRRSIATSGSEVERGRPALQQTARGLCWEELETGHQPTPPGRYSTPSRRAISSPGSAADREVASRDARPREVR